MKVDAVYITLNQIVCVVFYFTISISFVHTIWIFNIYFQIATFLKTGVYIYRYIYCNLKNFLHIYTYSFLIRKVIDNACIFHIQGNNTSFVILTVAIVVFF